MAARRQFTRELKREAVRLIKERGVSVAQASQDLGVLGLGEEVRRRSYAYLPWPGADEARAVRDRATQA
jgi:hypothetical protein